MFVSLALQSVLGSSSKPFLAFVYFFQNVLMHKISEILLVKKKKLKSEIPTDKSLEEHSVWKLTFTQEHSC